MVGINFGRLKGVRGSPFIFNIAFNYLQKTVRLARNRAHIVSLFITWLIKGVTILQYVNDTILIIQDATESARNLKLFLYLLELMSGLKMRI